MPVSSRPIDFRKEMAALVAGLAFPLGFSPFEIIPFAYISLACLFSVWEDIRPGRAFLRGLLFGIGQFGVGVYWIHVCLRDYAGSTEVAAFLISAAAVIFLALFPALAGFFIAVLSVRKHRALRLMWICPACWVFLEWFRAWLEFPGFPWLQVGYSQSDAIPGALAPLFGVYGVGFFVAFTAGTLVYSLASCARARKKALIVLASCWLLTASLQDYPWTKPVGRPLSVALLQGNIAQQLKLQPETKKQTLHWYLDKSRSHWGANLIVWPETAVPISFHRLSGLLDDLGAEAVRHGSDLLIGLPVYDSETNRSFNSIVMLGAGEGRYLKRHLVPFGEYLPFQPFSNFVTQHMDFKLAGFSPGPTQQPSIRAAGVPLAPSICYEDVFGQEMLMSMPDAQFLVNITNDAWFGRSIALDQNLQIARLRAMESGRYLVRAANTGLTAIVSPSGDVVKIAPRLTATVLTGEIQPMDGSTPYMRGGDYLVIGFISIYLLLFNLPWRAFRSVGPSIG